MRLQELSKESKVESQRQESLSTIVEEERLIFMYSTDSSSNHQEAQDCQTCYNNLLNRALIFRSFDLKDQSPVLIKEVQDSVKSASTVQASSSSSSRDCLLPALFMDGEVICSGQNLL